MIQHHCGSLALSRAQGDDYGRSRATMLLSRGGHALGTTTTSLSARPYINFIYPFYGRKAPQDN